MGGKKDNAKIIKYFDKTLINTLIEKNYYWVSKCARKNKLFGYFFYATIIIWYY